MKFPEECFLNILVRLPVKDIFRFKVVCKSWFNLISDPYFTKFYAKSSPFAILFRAQSNSSDSNNLSLSLLEIAGNGEKTLTPFTPKSPAESADFRQAVVIGSCGCSVFLLHRKKHNDREIHRVYLLNPILGSCYKVTEDSLKTWWRFCTEYKVGYIPSNSTYKLFRYITYSPPISSDVSYKKDAYKVLTIGLDKNWRNMDENLHNVLWQQVFCLNGAYHWVSNDMICTFDLLEEKKGTEIPIPHGVSSQISLMILNSCLSVIDQADDDIMVIWTMKEYGVVESWSKLTVLPLRNHPYPKYWNDPYFLPIGVFPNGNILFTEKKSKGIFIFSLEEKLLTETKYLDPQPSEIETEYVNTYARDFLHSRWELKFEGGNF